MTLIDTFSSLNNRPSLKAPCRHSNRGLERGGDQFKGHIHDNILSLATSPASISVLIADLALLIFRKGLTWVC